MLSGNWVASIPAVELGDVKSLKQRLHRLHGLPSRFRQRLFHEGSLLDDAAQLDSLRDLELLLLSYHPACQTSADELVTAAARGSVNEVEALLQKPREPHSTNADGNSPMETACSEGHAEVVSLLLEAGADKGVADNSGTTALMDACKEGHIEVVRLLLEAGADKDVGDNLGFTALMIACQKGRTEIARLLLEAGGDKDIINLSGTTALVYACQQGHTEVARLLLEAGADKDIATNVIGATALMAACQEGHIGVVSLLLEAGADKDYSSKTGVTALMGACQEGRTEVVRLLLEAGADKDVCNNRGFTALMIASQHGHAEVVRLLLETGASKDIATNDGVTALILAKRGTPVMVPPRWRRGHDEVVRLLQKVEVAVPAANTSPSGVPPSPSGARGTDAETLIALDSSVKQGLNRIWSTIIGSARRAYQKVTTFNKLFGEGDVRILSDAQASRTAMTAACILSGQERSRFFQPDELTFGSYYALHISASKI
ncbi:Kidins220 [Symbiodinium sp. KB8]|nr:Kidins220 [Symbiodinium sp. KB8]